MTNTFSILSAIVQDGCFAAVAAVGFSVISNPPRRTIMWSAFLAAVGHIVRYALMHFALLDISSASFCGAFVIGWLCLAFAYKLHCPTTTLYIPALLPMIPGMFAYRTLFAITQFLQNAANEELATHYMLDFFKNGITSFTVVFALAVGATLPTFILRKKAFTMTRAKR